jgi:hypothetical protein
MNNMFLPERNVFEGGGEPGSAAEKAGEGPEEAGEKAEKPDDERKEEFEKKVGDEMKGAGEKDKGILQGILSSLRNSWDAAVTFFQEKREALGKDIGDRLARFIQDPQNQEKVIETGKKIERTKEAAEVAAPAVKAAAKAAGRGVVERAGDTAKDVGEAIGDTAEDVGQWIAVTYEEIKLATKRIMEDRDASPEEKKNAGVAIAWLGENVVKFRGWYQDAYSPRVRATTRDVVNRLANEVSDVFGGIRGYLESHLESKEAPRETDINSKEARQRRKETMEDYKDRLDRLPNLPPMPQHGSSNEIIKNYFEGLRSYTSAVAEQFTELRLVLRRTHSIKPEQMLDGEREYIINITQKALEPVQNAIKNPGILKDRKAEWRTVAVTYFRLYDQLQQFGAPKMEDAQLLRIRSRLRSNMEIMTGVKMVSPENVDKKRNPFLYFIAMIAKAFGMNIHVDTKTNAVVGWTGTKADKTEACLRMSEAYMSQHSWQVEFSRLDIENKDLRSKLSTTLLNTECFPANNVDQVLSGRSTKRLFIEEVAKHDTGPEQIAKLNKALDHLNHNPLEIVNLPPRKAKKGQLAIKDFYLYMQDPDSTDFYPPETPDKS